MEERQFVSEAARLPQAPRRLRPEDSGQLVSRSRSSAVIHDATAAAERNLRALEDNVMVAVTGLDAPRVLPDRAAELLARPRQIAQLHDAPTPRRSRLANRWIRIPSKECSFPPPCAH
jgi:hypothetical protein